MGPDLANPFETPDVLGRRRAQNSIVGNVVNAPKLLDPIAPLKRTKEALVNLVVLNESAFEVVGLKDILERRLDSLRATDTEAFGQTLALIEVTESFYRRAINEITDVLQLNRERLTIVLGEDVDPRLRDFAATKLAGTMSLEELGALTNDEFDQVLKDEIANIRLSEPFTLAVEFNRLSSDLFTLTDELDEFDKYFEIFEGIKAGRTASIRITFDDIVGVAAEFRSTLDSVSAAVGFGVDLSDLEGLPDFSDLPQFQPFANGGTVNGPTLAFIGEGGLPAAVVPSPDGRSIPVMFIGGGPGGLGELGNIQRASEELAGLNGNLLGLAESSNFLGLSAERLLDTFGDVITGTVDLGTALKSVARDILGAIVKEIKLDGGANGEVLGSFVSQAGNFLLKLLPFADGGVMTGYGPLPLSYYGRGLAADGDVRRGQPARGFRAAARRPLDPGHHGRRRFRRRAGAQRAGHGIATVRLRMTVIRPSTSSILLTF